MSRYIKDLISHDLSRRLDGVQDALLVNVIGMNSNATFLLRKELREKNIHLLVVKNSLARRATQGTPLGGAFEGADGSLAVVWGSEDFISLTKEISRLVKAGKYEGLASRGGVMEGERLSAERVEQISKWPSRTEQLSILMGQILSPGGQLVAQMLAPGGQLVSQFEKLAEGGEAPEQPAEENPA
jgi:ribosomal protein L10